MADALTLEDFVESLLSEKLGGALFTPEERLEIKQELLTKLNRWIILQTMTTLAEKSPADLSAFQEMAKGNASLEDIQAFVASKIPDSSSFLTHVLVDFRNTYLGQIG